MFKCRHGLLGHETLKSAISYKCTYDVSWSSAFLYISRKAKSYTTCYWVVIANIGVAFYFMGLLNLLDLKNELINSADFLHAPSDKIIFG